MCFFMCSWRDDRRNTRRTRFVFVIIIITARQNSSNLFCSALLITRSFFLRIMPFSVFCCARMSSLNTRKGYSFRLLANDKTQTRERVFLSLPSFSPYLYDFESPRQITNAWATEAVSVCSCITCVTTCTQRTRVSVFTSRALCEVFFSLRDFNALSVSFHHGTNDARVHGECTILQILRHESGNLHWTTYAPNSAAKSKDTGSLPCRISCFTCRKNWYL